MMQEQRTYTKAEITQTLNVQPYIMALWEKQFGIQTTLTQGEHLYSAEDFAKLAAIKELLYEKGFTIEAAKNYLHANPQLQETNIIAASPLLFEVKSKIATPVALDATLVLNLRTLQEQLIKLRQLL